MFLLILDGNYCNQFLYLIINDTGQANWNGEVVMTVTYAIIMSAVLNAYQAKQIN